MSSTGPLKVLIAGGGTGGHLYPALAIADGLRVRRPDVQLHFIGSRFGIEKRIFADRNLPSTLLNVRGFQRSKDVTSIGRNLLFGPRLAGAYLKSVTVVKDFKPDVVVGTGGYASGLPLLAAVRQGIPALIQEQNSYPGFTTRWLADKVQKICIAFDEARAYIPADKTILTGNPVRADIADGQLTDAVQRFNLEAGLPTFFLFGGSQGSAILNQTLAATLPQLDLKKIQIIWQTGARQFDQYKNLDSDNIRVQPFIDDMRLAYALSSLVIARAGALTIAELTCCGLPAILVPLPSAAADHQTKNAQALEKTGGAILIPESTLTPEVLVNQVKKLIVDENLLHTMSDASAKLAYPEAADRIVTEILELAET